MGDIALKQRPLTNLRAGRNPEKSWQVEGQVIRATVQPSTLDVNPGARHIQLRITLETGGRPWKLLAASSPTKSVSISNLKPDSKAKAGKREFFVTFDAPARCTLENLREPVVLQLRFDLDGVVLSERMEVDHRCLLGNYYTDAQGVARLAQKYREDPLIRRLVKESRSRPRLSLWDEAKSFGKRIRYHYVPDPTDYSPPGGFLYGLSPTELSRFGGDCEDISTALGAYLTELGFRVKIAEYVGHARLRVLDPENPKEGYVDLEATNLSQTPRESSEGAEWKLPPAERILKVDPPAEPLAFLGEALIKEEAPENKAIQSLSPLAARHPRMTLSP